jgi:ribose transport system substrate-binding protein
MPENSDKAAPKSVERYRVGTLDKGLAVLDLLAKGVRPLSIQEVAAATGIERVTVFRLLCTLAGRGYVERLQNRKYRATSRRRRFLVGYCAPLTGTAFRTDLAASLRLAAESAGVDLLVIDNDESDAACSTKNAGLLIQAKVDLAVLFQPVEWIGHTMADQFLHASIPFITVEVPLPGGVYFGANNYQAGRLAGQVLGQFAAEHWKREVDRVVLVESSLTSALVAARLAGALVGLRAVLGPVDESRVAHLDGKAHVETSRDAMAEFLTQSKKGERLLVGCFNDQTAIGALQAVRAKSRERDVAIVGQNAAGESWDEIRNPRSRFIASIAYFPERYGGKLIGLARSILNREHVPPAVYTEHKVLDGSNIDRFYGGKPLV